MKDQFRSIGWQDIARLLDLEHVKFFSLQKGPAADQLVNSCDASRLVDLGPELEDFCDTAAVIAQLDLVVCVDTSVAHLAGGLGRLSGSCWRNPPIFAGSRTGRTALGIRRRACSARVGRTIGST